MPALTCSAAPAANVRYFALDNVGFFTVIERDDLVDTVTVILRDKKGRWVYNLALAQIEPEAAQPQAVVSTTRVEKVELAAGAPVDASRLVSVYAFMKSAKIASHPFVTVWSQ